MILDPKKAFLYFFYEGNEYEKDLNADEVFTAIDKMVFQGINKQRDDLRVEQETVPTSDYGFCRYMG